MALSPITPVPVLWQNSLVDLQPTSLYGRDHDRALVSTTLLLAVPADQEVDFVLPTSETPEANPELQVVTPQTDASQEFTETTLEQVEAEVFPAEGAVSPEQQGVWDAVKTAAKQWRHVKVSLKQGDQLLRFTYRQRLVRAEDESFELRVLAPLASFVLQPGGSISFAVGLPRVPGRNVSVDQAVAENPPGTPLADISERPVLAQRMFVAHYWQNDPLYRVKYRYV